VTDTASGAGRYRMVSSCRGAIAHVLLCLPAGFVDQSPVTASALVAAAGPVERLAVVTHARAAARVGEILQEAGRSGAPLVVPDETLLSVWVQDQAIAFEGDDPEDPPGLLAGPRLALSSMPVRPVATGAPLLDGGNLVVGDGVVFVGSDEWERWRTARAEPPPDDDPAARDLFAADYGTPARVVVVGGAEPSEAPMGRTVHRPDGSVWRHDPWPGIVAASSRQAVFHLDVFLTPAGTAPDGRPRLLVGDPALAAELAGLPPPDPAYQARFDAAAAQLQGEGFAVIRNPLPVVGTDHAHRRRRTMHMLSANNTWVEATDVERPRAWLPLFAASADDPQAAVDRAMETIWRGFGFEVVPVTGMGPLALRNGGLNCASKILRRRTEV
jgi:hypothetical protein